MTENQVLPQTNGDVNYSEASKILLRLAMLPNIEDLRKHELPFCVILLLSRTLTLLPCTTRQVPLCLIHWVFSPKRNSLLLDRTLIFHNLTRSGYPFMPRNCLYPYPSFLSCLLPFWTNALFCVWAGAYNVFSLVSGMEPKAHSTPFTLSLSNTHLKRMAIKSVTPSQKKKKK